MTPNFGDYIKAAFSARPFGMFVAPNWIGLAAFALLGLLNPGFWLLGLGLELAYLYALATNKRFQRYVAGTELVESRQESASKVRTMLGQLAESERQRYWALEGRCQAILKQQHARPDYLRDLQFQGEGLGRLLWIYLRLLLSRQAFSQLLRETTGVADRDARPLERRVRELEARVADPALTEDLRESLSGQLEILRQRWEGQREAREKLAYLDAELTRIEEQVELLREQAVLSTDPSAVAARIDEVAATLTSTNQWIRDQSRLYGDVADVLEEPPTVLVPPQAREAQ